MAHDIKAAPDALKIGGLYETSSGMGGTFDVKLLGFTEDGLAQLRVHMPRNPDWHGFRFTAFATDLRVPKA